MRGRAVGPLWLGLHAPLSLLENSPFVSARTHIRWPYSPREHHDGSACKHLAKMELSYSEGLAVHPKHFSRTAEPAEAAEKTRIPCRSRNDRSSESERFSPA